MSALIQGGDVAAAHLGFVGRGRFYYTVSACDVAYGCYRVGHQSIEEEFETFDLGVGDFAYRYTWATDHLPLYSHEHALTAADRCTLSCAARNA